MADLPFEVVDRKDLVPICPHCEGQLHEVYSHGRGIPLGQGRTVQQILSEMKEVAEGVKTSKSVFHLSHENKIEMPISHEVYRVLYEDKPAHKALNDLMARDLKREVTL